MSRPVALTAVSGGINRLRTKGGADKNSLFDLLNGYVTQAGTVKVREGTFRNANLGGQPLNSTVSILLHFDGGISDASSRGLPMTLVGAPSTAGGPQFGTGSLILSQTASSYASTPVTTGSPLDLGYTQQDWTIECFVNLSISATPAGNGMELIGATDIQTNPAYPSLVASNNGGVVTITAGIFGALAGKPIAANTWTHVAHTRHGNTYTLWINGVNVASVTSASVVTSGLVPFFVGPLHYNGGSPPAIAGFLDEVRVSNGVALYTANFTPPIAAFPSTPSFVGTPGATKGLMAYQGQLHVFSNTVVPVPPGYALHVLNYPYTSAGSSTLTVIPPTTDSQFANVAFLASFDGADGTIIAYDSSNPSCTPLSFGSLGATISQTLPKRGSASAHFLNANAFTKYAIGTASPYAGGSLQDIFTQSSWTIEFWFKVDVAATGTSINLMSYGDDLLGGVSSEIVIAAGVNTANNLTTVTVQDYSNWSTGDTRSGSIASGAGNWHHFALVANGGTPVMYLDGVAQASLNPLWIPARYGHSGNTHIVMGSFGRFNGAPGSTGNMDDVRVTANVARYTANFTPPTAAFPANTCIYVPPTIKAINFAAPYLGGIYVSATFNITDPTLLAKYGDTFHYWIQSSTVSGNSNAWAANTDYRIGDVVIPSSVNGLTYVAGRHGAANPVWAPNTTETAGNVVEPTIANGFAYTATTVIGAKPTTGATEPTWPTSDGAIVNENSSIANDQTVTQVSAGTGTPTPTVPSRYAGGIAGGFIVKTKSGG